MCKESLRLTNLPNPADSSNIYLLQTAQPPYPLAQFPRQLPELRTLTAHAR